MVTCELCGRPFKNTQGLRGHKTFVHGMYASSNTPANKTGNLNSLSKLENRVELLEKRIGLDGTSLLDPANVDKPSYDEQLIDMSKQVSSLTQQLVDISRNKPSTTDLAGVADKVDELTRQVSDLSRSVQPVKHLPGNVVCLENELADRASNSRVAALESRISRIEEEHRKADEQTKLLVEATGESLKALASGLQQLQLHIKEIKLVTDWVKKENDLRLAAK